jgi:hypothetical protein
MGSIGHFLEAEAYETIDSETGWQRPATTPRIPTGPDVEPDKGTFRIKSPPLPVNAILCVAAMRS